MEKTQLAQTAYDFLNTFKTEVLKQMDELNTIADGELQDGYNATFIDDGWVYLKGCSWGFVMLYDEPVRIDMTFGGFQPFVGYRETFTAKQTANGITWTNQTRSNETYYDAAQLARYGLRRLAQKVGDEWLFENLPAVSAMQITSGEMKPMGAEATDWNQPTR